MKLPAFLWSAFALFFLISVPSFSQTGVLSGTIIDGETKETLIGATVRLAEINLGTYSDFNGFYSLSKIPEGKYTCIISYTGYDDFTIRDIEIKEGEKVTLDVVMSATSLEFEEVTITEYRQTNSVNAVLLEVRQSKQVVSGISSQQIQKSQDNNAAEVVKRVPGVTIVDNRFVMIRGLNERYNNVMVNNVTAPSTEIDRRTFSFDLISSNALDRMLIFKSGSPELPGDFAGGVIKIFTVGDVAENFTKINVGVGYRAGTTGADFFQSKGSATDFLGFDNGFRKLPGNFPSTFDLQSSGRNGKIREDAAELLPNNWVASPAAALPDHSIGISLGRNIQLGAKKLSTINSLNWSTSFQTYQRDFLRYFEWSPPFNVAIDKRFEFLDNTFEKQNRISLLSNWNLRLNNNNSITFKNLFNQIGENETIVRNGFDFIQRPNDDLRNYLLGYRSRSIYLGQFEGSHQLSPRRSLHWVLGGSFLSETEPDLRRFRTFRPMDGSESGFLMQLPPSSNLFETGRYFGNLSEYSFSQATDYTWTLSEKGGRKAVLKTGYLADYRNRAFDSRYISYLYPGFFDPFEGERLRRLPLDQIFSQSNISTLNGFVIEEGTRPIDAYTASSLTTAGYVGADLPWRRFNVSLGFRGEFNEQRINSQTELGTPIQVQNPVFAALPFINTDFKLTETSLVRLGYSTTINRPEFRELAPFVFYDYKLEGSRFGNPDLKTAFISNLDLRYEVYPRPGETFNVGVFYKYFNDPIENKTVITTELPNFTFINADWARNYGVEVEFRKSLRGVTSNAFIDKFSINTNASLIRSRVDLGSTAVAQDRMRPLQGQSPYILNFALYYDDDQEHGLSGSLVYNIFGNRIFSVGDVVFPTIYELSRNSLDITVTKRFNRTSYKLGVQNILNAPFRFFQDSDRNETIDVKVDHPIIVFRRGQLVSLSFSYDLSKK